MVFKRGPQYRLFITTENASGSILCTGTSPVATTSSGLGPHATTIGIGKLAEYTGTTTSTEVCEIKNVEGIEPTPGWIDDPFTVFGQTRELDNPIRTQWGFVVTRKGEDKLFYKLARSARFGVTGSSAVGLFDGLSALPDSTGYRLYLYDGTDWDVFMHGTLQADGYKETLSPTGVTVQQITFKGGLWTPAMASGSFTSSVSIVQV